MSGKSRPFELLLWRILGLGTCAFLLGGSWVGNAFALQEGAVSQEATAEEVVASSDTLPGSAESREQLVEGAQVSASAWMPDHNHGTHLQPKIISHGDGTATGDGFLLHMEGQWELKIGVAVNGRMERAVVPVDSEP